MAAKGYEEDDEIVGINITPLVDVCLVLVIIFMVTAPMMSDPVIKVQLPKARTQEGEERDKVTITLSKDGEMAIDAKKFKDFTEMEPELRARLGSSESKLVVLRADEAALHGPLTDLMAKAKDAGALSLTIATEQVRD